MRINWLALPGILLASAVLLAQPPAPPLNPAPDKLDEVLGNWEKAMTGVQSLLAICNWTSLDKVFQTKDVYEGTVKFVRSAQKGLPSRASLEMFKKGRQDEFIKLVYTGNYLYEYAAKNKIIRVHKLPPSKTGQVADDNFLNLIMGMTAAEAKKRYKLTYVPPPANDKWWYYIKIQTIHPGDKNDFVEAQLVLGRSNFLPRRVWCRKSNGDEITLDFPKVISPADIRVTEFATPQLPPGWRFEMVPNQPPPARVVRPQN